MCMSRIDWYSNKSIDMYFSKVHVNAVIDAFSVS